MTHSRPDSSMLFSILINLDAVHTAAAAFQPHTSPSLTTTDRQHSFLCRRGGIADAVQVHPSLRPRPATTTNTEKMSSQSQILKSNYFTENASDDCSVVAVVVAKVPRCQNKSRGKAAI